MDNCGTASEALWVSLPPIRLSPTTTCLLRLKLTIACSPTPTPAQSHLNSLALLNRERRLNKNLTFTQILVGNNTVR